MPRLRNIACFPFVFGLAVAASALPVARAQACACCGTYKVVGVDDDDALNVRSGPGTGFAIVTTLQPGEGCIIKTGQRHGSWVGIEALGQKGWVHGRYLDYIR